VNPAEIATRLLGRMDRETALSVCMQMQKGQTLAVASAYREAARLIERRQRSRASIGNRRAASFKLAFGC
jgi:hypothetical protein